MHGVLGEEETRILRLSLGKLHRRTYAEQFGLELFEPHDVEPLDGPVTLGGRRLGPQAMKTHFEEMKMATQRMTTDAVKVDADEPWKSPQAAELDRLTTARSGCGRYRCRTSAGSPLPLSWPTITAVP